jgi:hypothetical protein
LIGTIGTSRIAASAEQVLVTTRPKVRQSPLGTGDQTMNKQIEEMAKDLAESIVWDNEDILTIDCYRTARMLSDKYRKASDVRAEAITEFAERLKKFYGSLKGKTVGGSVEYHIEQIAKEMKGENSNDH